MQSLVDRYGVTFAIQDGNGAWLFLPRPTRGVSLAAVPPVDLVAVAVAQAASDTALASFKPSIF